MTSYPLWITILVVCVEYKCSAVYEICTHGAMGGTKIFIFYPFYYCIKLLNGIVKKASKC